MKPRDNPNKDNPNKYAAIHRALLSGLLSNIGHKTDTFEYSGARGSKFNIHPGSSLFQRRPQWIMAAELVETTKLYARTVAGIQPEWIERVADHLVKRAYTDPHWNASTQHVVATEKVTLYGLPIIPQRMVHFGPIDPKKSRELFIAALVDGEYRTDAPFHRHNLRLIDEIQRMEAKSRSADILVDHQIRFDFYNARIPAGIFSGPLFEKWRRDIERHNPKVLFMSRRDLMAQSGSGITQDLFPDSISVNGLALPLEYHFEPGHVADGVTVRIPLAMLQQVPSERFEWIVPGLLREKITALIKSLPKNLRVNFVPAPEFAEAAAKALQPNDGSLYEALAQFLGKQKGIGVSPADFDPSSLLDHLHMNFKIVDEAGKTLETGRDLDAIRRKLGLQVRSTFSQLHHPQFTREEVHRWDFGDLPESVQVKRHGMTITAFPSLAATDEGVALRLFESKDAAEKSHEQGLRKLLQTELRDEIKYFAANIPNLHQMCLHYATLGTCQQLKEDIIGKTLNRAFLPDANVRTQMEYELRKVGGRRHRLLEIGREVADLAGRILEAYHQVALLLAKTPISAWAAAYADVKNQLAYLMPKDFLTTTPDAWLVHFPRFLKGIVLRLQKLVTVGHSRDAERMAEFAPLWDAYIGRARKHREEHLIDPELARYRWMLEELRISLFAQELKTSIPVSPKRLEKQWELVRR